MTVALMSPSTKTYINYREKKDTCGKKTMLGVDFKVSTVVCKEKNISYMTLSRR